MGVAASLSRRARLPVLAAVVIALVVGGTLALRAGAGTPTVLTSTEVLAGNIVLAPPPAGASAAITQAQAIQAGEAEVGANGTLSQAVLASLTDPRRTGTEAQTDTPGGGTPLDQDRLVWDVRFTGQTECPPTGQIVGSVPPGPSQRCTSATTDVFIDANTGAFLYELTRGSGVGG